VPEPSQVGGAGAGGPEVGVGVQPGPGGAVGERAHNRLQALTADVQGIAIAVWVNTLPRLKRDEPWYEIGVDDPDRRRQPYPEPAGR
jgi:hypothetical protein